MHTERLYLTHPYQHTFTAQILTCTQVGDTKWAVVLDKTAFYPEGGGQPSDTGFMNHIPVLQVYEEGETIVHILPSPIDSGTISGSIDWDRRYDHMQQHTGQHILSEIFFRQLQGKTIGFHLGAASSTIDLTLAALSSEQVAVVEEAANRAIAASQPITSEIISPEQLVHYKLRKKVSSDISDIRLVTIGDIDCCACCGTHLARSSEVGLIKILSWEKKNQAIRVEFLCGKRAFIDYHCKHAATQTLCTRLSAASCADLLIAYEKHCEKFDSANKQLAEALQQLAVCKAQQWHSETVPSTNNIKIICRVLPNTAPGELGVLAKELTSHNLTIALLAGLQAEQNKIHFLFCRSSDLTLSMNECLKKILGQFQGKGGGSPQTAQGGCIVDQISSDHLETALQQIHQDIIGLLAAEKN